MKKAWLFTTILCFLGLSTTMIAQQKAPYHDDYLSRNTLSKKHLDSLFHKGLYDSVLTYCALARKENSMSFGDLELALAMASWYKGDKSTAYQYVLNDADYELKLNGGGGAPFGMLYDYTFGPALASDTFLEKMITGKVSDYYLAMHYYPDAPTGLKLMILDYKEQKLIKKYLYDRQHNTREAEKKVLQQQYAHAYEVLEEQLMALLKENKKLFNRNDTGPGSQKQLRLIHNLKKAEDLAWCKSLVYQAMTDKEVTPEAYIEVFLAAEKLKNDDESRLSILKDSLCRVYGCNIQRTDAMTRLVYYTGNGDSVSVSGDSVRIRSLTDSMLRKMIKTPERPQK